MTACGSFSSGETRMPPPGRVRGSGGLFSNSLAPRFAAAAAAAAVRPLACCLPAGRRGSPAPKACLKWGFGARPGRTRVGEGRKVQNPDGGVSCPSTEKTPKILLSFQLQKDSPALSLSLSRNQCLALGRRQFLRLPGSPNCLQTCRRARTSPGCLQTCPRARTVLQVHVPGQVLTELSGGAAGAAASSFRGRRVPSQGCSPARPCSDSALRT